MKAILIVLLCLSIALGGCAPVAITPTQPAATTAPALDQPTANVSTSAPPATIRVPEGDPVLRLDYDPALTGPAAGALVPPGDNSPDQPFFTQHPAYLQVRFAEYAQAGSYQLPFPIDAPQIMVYQARDFAGYSSDSPYGWPAQLERLNALLAEGVDPARCGKTGQGPDLALPFLPVVNAAQVFCARLQPLAFQGGQGIRYVTYYDQGLGPKAEGYAFYTFQGRTDDGQYYLSALFPVRTNVLPADPPDLGTMPDLDALAAVLAEQVATINAQQDEAFSPSLARLDALIAGIKIPAD